MNDLLLGDILYPEIFSYISSGFCAGRTAYNYSFCILYSEIYLVTFPLDFVQEELLIIIHSAFYIQRYLVTFGLDFVQ